MLRGGVFANIVEDWTQCSAAISVLLDTSEKAHFVGGEIIIRWGN